MLTDINVETSIHLFSFKISKFEQNVICEKSHSERNLLNKYVKYHSKRNLQNKYVKNQYFIKNNSAIDKNFRWEKSF